MDKLLVFDMDGTIADLYGVDNWLTDLRAGVTRPYEIAEPIYNMEILVDLLQNLKALGWKVVITSWLSMGATKEYDDRVRVAKTDWLNRYNFPYDEIHLVKYGTTKADCTRKYKGYQVLIDDNEKIRNGWHLGSTINANENILVELKKLLTN